LMMSASESPGGRWPRDEAAERLSQADGHEADQRVSATKTLREPTIRGTRPGGRAVK
jgi:hypothetical protein